MNTDDNQFDYELTETYDASRQRVFTALTDATTLKLIWGVQEIRARCISVYGITTMSKPSQSI